MTIIIKMKKIKIIDDKKITKLPKTLNEIKAQNIKIKNI